MEISVRHGFPSHGSPNLPMICLDTETTGMDLHHGAKPFFVTLCRANGEQMWWEWDVDPLTRKPKILVSDLVEISKAVHLSGEELVLQNAKFDVAALVATEYQFPSWPWNKTHDTLLAGHLLASNQPHDLTSMALYYLDAFDLEPYEKSLEVAVKESRKLAVKEFPNWQLAAKGRLDMPSAKEKTWKYDCWLPRALAKELRYDHGHPWHTVLRDYSNADSSTTLALWIAMERELKRRKLWKIYQERRGVLPVIAAIEHNGVTLSVNRLEKLTNECREESCKAGQICINLASSLMYELELPKGAVNNSLRKFCFEVLKLKPIRNHKAKTSAPSLGSKIAMSHYLGNLPRHDKALTFVRNLTNKRASDTALAYMESYRRFWVPLHAVGSQGNTSGGGVHRLHPFLNPTGTDTLRCSSFNPNEQNISKRDGRNLRYCFGPAPGREWWSLDAENIELRIPAYEAGEAEMVDLFNRPNDPPYYGKVHLLMFDTVYPEIFARHGAKVKELFASTYYQWVKNGDFAVQYGSVEESGTADRAYHRPGAFAKVKGRFARIHGPGGLNERCIRFAEKHGYVETLPDKTVDQERGYPLLCARSKWWGKILPTVPLNYHVQGTACWWMMKAMIRCHEQLDKWNALDGFYGFITLQVHDELVFDLPVGDNFQRILVLKKLMEEGGNDIGLPTPVGIEYYADDWGKGVPR